MGSVIVVKWLALNAAILMPDVVLNFSALTRKTDWLKKYILIVGFLTLPLAVADFDLAAISALATIVTLSGIWHASYLYFGGPVRAEYFEMMAKPDHFRDVIIVGKSELRRFVPLFLLLIVSFAVGCWLLTFDAGVPYSEWLGPVTWLLIILRGVKVGVTKSDVQYMHPSMPGWLGSLQSLSVAIAWQLFPVRPLPGHVRYDFQGTEEATVVVLMGESIAPSRLDIFGQGPGLTPNITALNKNTTGPYRLFSKLGLSAAVSSNASVASFLSGSPFSWRTEGARTLFDLAKEQGFKTFYWSGQTRSPVEILNGGRHVDSEHCYEHSRELFDERKDWVLVDKLLATEAEPREFFSSIRVAIILPTWIMDCQQNQRCNQHRTTRKELWPTMMWA